MALTSFQSKKVTASSKVPPAMPRPVWLQTDDTTEGVLALEMAVEQLGRVLEEPYRWKWVIVALHNSLQAFMAAALRGSAGIGAMRNDYIDQWREAYDRGTRPMMEPTLASFNTLWARIQSPKWVQGFSYSKPLSPSTDQEQAVKRIKFWRDAFIHYSRDSLSIECGGYPDFTRGALEVIDAIVFDTGHINDHQARIREAIDAGRTHLTAIGADYDRR